MARKLAACPHCKGKMNCTRSGGRSCKKYCGGTGKVWEETEDAPAEPAEAPAATAKTSEPPAEA
jgi:hypothetical protein